MCFQLLHAGRLFALLLEIDRLVAEKFHFAPCPRKGCSGVLHTSWYRRLLRGLLPSVRVDKDFNKRFSFCCSREGCRHRVTPPSVRFLGRKTYIGVAVVLMSAMCEGLTPRRVQVLREALGVDRRTLVHWREWWREEFVKTACWKELRAGLAGRVDERDLPLSVWERFGLNMEGLVELLKHLSPLSFFSGRASPAQAV